MRAPGRRSHVAGVITRRDFLSRLGVTAAAALGGSVAGIAHAQEEAKGRIPDKPFKIGHMTFFTGAGAVLGEPMYKGNLLAAEEINAHGGLLGKRKIEILRADEAAGTDANTKEMRRLKLSEKIDMFMGILSSGNTPALGPIAEELKLLTIFVDGTSDFLFDKAVPHPRYIFRINNLTSVEGATCGVAVAMSWPDVKRVAHIHPDYAYGRNIFDHFNVVAKKLMPRTQNVGESWPKLFSTDFTPHITKAIAANPDLLVTSLWGGDYVSFYKQALPYGLFEKMKVATTLALGAPHAIGKDHPEGVLAGVHANYHFSYPPKNRSPLNRTFVEKYHAKFSEYPNFAAEGAYTATYLLKTAVEKANKLRGGWPDDDAIIDQLEGMIFAGPAGYIYIRTDNHQGYKDAITGFSKNVPEYPFPILDPNRIITIPIRNITSPAGWPKGEPTSTYSWIDQTWPVVKAN
jgi:branched-chain amino acid transport system substrate-binding protein